MSFWETIDVKVFVCCNEGCENAGEGYLNCDDENVFRPTFAITLPDGWTTKESGEFVCPNCSKTHFR